MSDPLHEFPRLEARIDEEGASHDDENTQRRRPWQPPARVRGRKGPGGVERRPSEEMTPEKRDSRGFMSLEDEKEYHIRTVDLAYARALHRMRGLTIALTIMTIALVCAIVRIVYNH